METTGILYLNSCFLDVYHKPILGIKIWDTRKRRNSFGCVLREPSCCSRVIAMFNKSGYELVDENNQSSVTKNGNFSVGFQPTFNEYLKAMESVKTPVRDVNESRKSSTSSRVQQKNIVESRFSTKVRTNDQREHSTTYGSLSNEDLGGENFGLVKNESSTLIHKKNARGSKLEMTNSFSRINTRIEGQRNSRVERRKLGQFGDNQNLTDEEEFFNSHTRSSSTYKRDVGYSKIISNVQERPYGIPKNFRNSEEPGRPRCRTIYLRSNVEAERNGDKVSRTSGKFIRCNVEDVDMSDLEMERAAFKSFEVFTDVRDRPRVSRMELEERIEKLAKWLNGTDINLPQWLFSKMLRSAKIRFTDHSILRVIQILGTLGNWRRVLQIIEWLQSRERFKSYKSRYIYTAALDVLGKTKKPVEALNVFHVMRQEFSSYPDLASYHCIAVTLGQAGHLKELFDVIDCMQSPPEKMFKIRMLEKWDPRLKPDIVVYNSVLNACVRRKQWEGAFWVLQQLKQEKLQPSSTTYGLVMEVMFTCGKYNLVHEFFKKVEKSSIPNSLNYRVVVNTLWKEGKTDEAMLVVEDMERRGIVGSANLYYDLARCLCSAGRCQEALMQIGKICKVANRPLVVTYTGLIQACLDMGNVENGAYIYKQMHKFCSPNLVTCNIMLKAYAEYKMFGDAKDLFQKMLDGNNNYIGSSRDDSSYILARRVIPDNYTFNTMLDACIMEQKWDVFIYVYQQMLHYGYNFNTKRHLRMILEACRAGKGELLEITWKHLVQANRIPPPPIIKERFCMKLEADDYSEAICSLNIVLSSSNKQTKDNNLLLHAFSHKSWFNLFKINSNRFQKDTFVNLRQELNTVFAGSDRMRLPVILNLLTSCEEFLRTDINPVKKDGSICLSQLEPEYCK